MDQKTIEIHSMNPGGPILVSEGRNNRLTKVNDPADVPPGFVRAAFELAAFWPSVDAFARSEIRSAAPGLIHRINLLADARPRGRGWIDPNSPDGRPPYPIEPAGPDSFGGEDCPAAEPTITVTPPPVRYFTDADRPNDARICDRCGLWFTGPAKIDARFTFCGDVCQAEAAEYFDGADDPAAELRPAADPNAAAGVDRSGNADPGVVDEAGRLVCLDCLSTVDEDESYFTYNPTNRGAQEVYCSLECIERKLIRLKYEQ